MKSKNNYALPIDEKDIKKIIFDSPSHKGKLKYAVDYTCDKDTEILASEEGEIVWVKQDSKIGGPENKYWDKGNRIVIKHKNGEYTGYEHLKFQGAEVKVGDKVKKGQLIGYAGNTGMCKPTKESPYGHHLHFEVFHFTGPDKDEDQNNRINQVK